MQRFYSRQTGCTYLEGIHTELPADAKEITEKRFLAVLATPVDGKVIGHDSKGLPILIDPPAEQLAALARGWRDAEIGRIQWLRDRHLDQQAAEIGTTLEPAQFTELLTYIQALRDWPLSPEFPTEGSRPVTPTWITQQIQ